MNHLYNDLFHEKVAVVEIYIEPQPTPSIDALFLCLWAILPLK